jgi:hypothetical protein
MTVSHEVEYEIYSNRLRGGDIETAKNGFISLNKNFSIKSEKWNTNENGYQKYKTISLSIFLNHKTANFFKHPYPHPFLSTYYS